VTLIEMSIMFCIVLCLRYTLYT